MARFRRREVNKSEIAAVGDGGPKYALTLLKFHNPDDEAAYVAYRKPRIMRTLRWVLILGAIMAFVGGVVDFAQLEPDAAWAVTALRVIAAIGIVGAFLCSAFQLFSTIYSLLSEPVRSPFICCGLPLCRSLGTRFPNIRACRQSTCC